MSDFFISLVKTSCFEQIKRLYYKLLNAQNRWCVWWQDNWIGCYFEISFGSKNDDFSAQPSQSGRVVYSTVFAVCGHGFESQTSTNTCRHVCKWIKKTWLPYSQQVLHHRWISLCTGDEACKQGIHPGFETHGRCHPKSKTGVSVAPQKELMYSKK